MYTTNAKISSLITTTQDIDSMIVVASRLMDAYVGYRIGIPHDEVGKDYFYDGRGQKDLYLHQFYQKDGLVIQMDGVTVESVLYPLNDDATCQITSKTGKYNIGNGNITLLNAKKGRYKLDWGGNNHTLPSDLETACVAIVGALIKKADGGDISSGVKSSETIGAYSVSYDNSEITLNNSDVAFVGAKSILNDYKLISIS